MRGSQRLYLLFQQRWQLVSRGRTNKTSREDRQQRYERVGKATPYSSISTVLWNEVQFFLLKSDTTDANLGLIL
jgi:hypothetical protein